MATRSTVCLLLSIITVFHSTRSVIIFDEDTTHTTPTNPKFTHTELECFKMGKVLYERENKCYKLLEVGPCIGERQWLVLDKEEVVAGNGRLRAVCRQCPCCGKPYRAVFWPEDGQCHRLIRESNQLCPALGTVLQIDPFGEGECACKKDPPHARWDVKNVEDNGPCYPLYRRGPCESGFIFVSSDNTTKCKKDPCSQLNQGHSEAVFAAFEDGNGRCYKLGSKGPCQGESTIFDVHPVSRKPACFTIVNQIVDLPPNCDTDQDGNCRQEIALPSDADYVTDLLMAAQKKRYRRRTRVNKHQDIQTDG